MTFTPIRRRVSRLTAAAAVTTVAALALTACTGSAEEPAPSGSAVERELSLAVNAPPNSMDPALLSDGQATFVWGAVLDTLLKRENGTGVLQPNAAESWSYNDDGTELTLEIRDGMTFSDGDPVDANAVVATMERTMATPGPVQPKFAAVTGVEATDDQTVLISFEQFDPQFIDQLATSGGAIGDPDTLDDETTATNPIGSGPYTLDVDATVPGTSYTLVKRDDYWDAENFPFTTVKATVLQDPTAAFNAVQAGEINAATISPQQAASLDPNAYTSTPINAQAVASLVILDKAGESFPALGDVRVRQAINYAIDRDGIVTGLLRGNGTGTAQVFSPFLSVFDEELNDDYEYDPEKGRELVEEAGFTGTVLKVPSTYLTTTFEATLAQAFSDIGLGIEWVPVPPQQVGSIASSGEYGLYFQIGGFGSDALDANNYYGPTGFYNPRGYTDPTIEEYFDVINSTVDSDEALPAYRDLNAYAVDQALNVPIAYLAANWVTSDGIVMLDNGAAATIQNVRLFGVAE